MLSHSNYRWLGFRLEVLGAFIIFSAAVFAVLSRGSVSGGIVGLSITYALQVILLWAPAQRKRATMLYFANVFFIFIFLWPPYSPALVNGGSRKFYT